MTRHFPEQNRRHTLDAPTVFVTPDPTGREWVTVIFIEDDAGSDTGGRRMAFLQTAVVLRELCDAPLFFARVSGLTLLALCGASGQACEVRGG